MTLPTVASEFSYSLMKGPNSSESLDLTNGLDNGSCGSSLTLSYGGSAFSDGTPVPFSA